VEGSKIIKTDGKREKRERLINYNCDQRVAAK